MAVFRIEKTKSYTVMSNHHLRNTQISLKAKGLLSQMLSLPDDWDYSLKGLASINKESIDAIRTAVIELEKAGYITRQQGRDEKGKMTTIVYTIYEQPQSNNPILENPTSGYPQSDNYTQLNKEEITKELQNTNVHSILSRKRDEPRDMSCVHVDSTQAYEETVKGNIEYDCLLQDDAIDNARLDEIVALMVEVLCTRRERIRVAGDEYPTELVKARFMKLDYSHIQFVFHCMRENTTRIRNIKQYLLTVLFNAPVTIDSYYTSLVNHDIHGS